MKKKSCILLFVLMAAAGTAAGQDTLYRTGGGREYGNVELVSVTYVRFKDVFTGRQKTIKRRHLLYIKYDDGAVDTFEGFYSEQKEIGYYKNQVTINVLNLPLGNIHLGYEHMLAQVIGVRLSVNAKAFYTGAENEMYIYDRRLTTGLDLNFYVSRSETQSLYLGPAFRVGTLADAVNYYNSALPRKEYEARFNYTAYLLQCGANFYHLHQRLCLGFQVAAGAAELKLANTLPPNHYYKDKIEKPEFFIALHVGYRF